MHIKTLEPLFKGLIENEVKLTDIMLALHNVCSHGTIIGDGISNQEDLTNLYEGFELCIRSAIEIEG